MTIQKLLAITLILTMGIYPLTMNSADIYERARGNGRIIANLNGNIITEDNILSSTVFIISTKEEYKAPEIFSKCKNSQNLSLSSTIGNNFIYIINFSFIGNCNDRVVYVKNGDEIYTETAYSVNIMSYVKNFVDSSDLSNAKIEETLAKIDINSFKLDNEIFSLKQKLDLASKITLIQKLYIQKYEQYNSIFLSNLLASRKSLRYASPVVSKVVPTKKNIIPNAGRPYRAKYTDGVHHGWDIFAKRGTPTRALSDGVVVRIVRDFNWNKFDNILWRNLNIQDKAKNLDIYRGNQVWIKTADGNVTIYAHLENIPENLKEGQFVNMGEYFGQIGRSGVPDKEYTDFHLHFEVQLNPHNRQNNSPLDIMLWQYYGKGKGYSDIISGQAKLFAAGVSSLK